MGEWNRETRRVSFALFSMTSLSATQNEALQRDGITSFDLKDLLPSK